MKNRTLIRVMLCLAVCLMAAPAFAATGPFVESILPTDLSASMAIGVGIVAIAGRSLKELREERGKIGTKLDELRDKNAKTDQAWSAEDQTAFEQVCGDYDTLTRAIELEERSSRLRQPDGQRDVGRDDLDSRDGQQGDGDDRQHQAPTERDRAMALQAWMRHANDLEPTAEQREAARRVGVNFRSKRFEFRLAGSESFEGRSPVWNRAGKPMHQRFESRDLSVGTPADGGYTVPTGFINRLEEAMLYVGGPRQVAQIMRTDSGNSLPLPTVDDTANEGEQLDEAASIGDSVDPTFASKTWLAFKFSSKAMLVSEELLEDSAFNLTNWIGTALGTRIGRIQATRFTTGNGTTQPQGVVTGASAGVTAAATNAFAAGGDELLALLHAVDPSYRGLPSCGWMMHDSILLKIRQLKDTTNRYIWQRGLEQGEPDRLLEYPIAINQKMASSLAASAVPVLFGAWEHYIIRDVRQVRLYRLNERYRDNDQTGFIAFMRSDGRYDNTAAVKKLTMAAS